MKTYTEQTLQIKVDRAGNRLLRNGVFRGNSFEEFVLGPQAHLQQAYAVEHCRFENCRVAGPCLIYPGVLLRNVVFDNFRTNDAITISTHALVDRVTIRGGSKGKGLWVKPFLDECPLEQDLAARNADWMAGVKCLLDISGLAGGEVEILGLPAEKVVINPLKHVVLRRNGQAIPWGSLSIPKSSLWRIRRSRLDDFDVDVGIYDIPEPGEDDEALAEFQRLRKEGFL